MSSWSSYWSSEPVKPEDTWVAKQAVVLRLVKRTEAGDIDTATYLDAIARVTEIYDAMFPGYWPVMTTVRNLLKNDIENGVNVVRTGAAECPDGKGATLKSMVTYQLETMGADACRTAKDNATKSLLWLNRSTTFMSVLLRNIVSADTDDATSAAYAAYEKVLKQYHTDTNVFVVGNAMSLAPGRSGVLSALQMTTEELVQTQLIPLLELMEPLVAWISAMLSELGANFPDKM